jgi:hypothetical protein
MANHLSFLGSTPQEGMKATLMAPLTKTKIKRFGAMTIFGSDLELPLPCHEFSPTSLTEPSSYRTCCLDFSYLSATLRRYGAVQKTHFIYQIQEKWRRRQGRWDSEWYQDQHCYSAIYSCQIQYNEWIRTSGG